MTPTAEKIPSRRAVALNSMATVYLPVDRATAFRDTGTCRRERTPGRHIPWCMDEFTVADHADVGWRYGRAGHTSLGRITRLFLLPTGQVPSFPSVVGDNPSTWIAFGFDRESEAPVVAPFGREVDVFVGAGSASAGSQIVRIAGVQARPLGCGTSIGTEILLAFEPLRPACRRVLPLLLTPVERQVEQPEAVVHILGAATCRPVSLKDLGTLSQVTNDVHPAHPIPFTRMLASN